MAVKKKAPAKKKKAPAKKKAPDQRNRRPGNRRPRIMAALAGLVLLGLAACGAQGQAMRACLKDAAKKCAIPCAECNFAAYRACRAVPTVAPASAPVPK